MFDELFYVSFVHSNMITIKGMIAGTGENKKDDEHHIMG